MTDDNTGTYDDLISFDVRRGDTSKLNVARGVLLYGLLHLDEEPEAGMNGLADMEAAINFLEAGLDMLYDLCEQPSAEA